MSARDPAVVSVYASLLLALGIPKRRRRATGRHRPSAARPEGPEDLSGLSTPEREWIAFLQDENRRTHRDHA